MSETHDLISGLNPVDQWVRQPPPTLPQPSVQPPPIQNGQAPARPAGQAADPLAPVMAKISSGESGGDDPYHETYGGGHFGWQGVPNTGSGKYGFVKSTWETASQGWMAANPGQPPPNFNEPQDQDRVARFWAQKTYKDKTGGRDLAADAQAGKVDYSALSGQWPSLDPNHSMHKGWADQDRAQHQQQGDGFREMWREYMKLATAETPGSAKRAELLYKAQASAERATEAFEQYQKTPPYYKPVDIMENFGSAATLLAIIGGAFAKRPLTASLQAAGLSMAAHQQQNWDQFKVANEQWKTQAEMGLQTVRLMHDQIREVMDDERLAENERQAKLHNLLSGMQMSQQQQQQWQTHTDRMLIASETAAQRLDNQKQRWEEHLDRIEEQKLAREGRGQLQDKRLGLFQELEDARESKDPDRIAAAEKRVADLNLVEGKSGGQGRWSEDAMAALVARAFKGDPTVMSQLPRSGPARQQYEEALAAKLKAEPGGIEGGNAQMIMNRLRMAEATSAAGVGGRVTMNTEIFAQEAVLAGQEVVRTSNLVPRTELPKVNAALLAYERNTGDPNIIQFGAALNALMNAYGKLSNPTGTGIHDADKDRLAN